MKDRAFSILPDTDIHTSASYTSYSEALLIFVRSNENEIYKIRDQVVTKLLTRVRLWFSHLREHKFWHDVLHHNCTSILRCQFFNKIRQNLMNYILNTQRSLPSVNQSKLQLWAKYLRQTLVFMSNNALREKFSFYFSAAFC